MECIHYGCSTFEKDKFKLIKEGKKIEKEYHDINLEIDM